MFSAQSTVHKRIWLAWALLFVGLIATVVVTMFMKMDVEADAKRDFDLACVQIQLRIDARMQAHAQILRSAAAVFAASEKVTREEWHIFTMQQKVEQYLPGIQGIGFSLAIPREQLIQHIQEIRGQGFSDYDVKPKGDRQIYSSIMYLEPFSGRNLRAFGYDMFSEPVRRKAMEQARDLNVAALSGKVTLVQETDQDVQAGTLMYVPVYRKGMATDTIAHRRAALYGWVYSPYRMNDLMYGISREWDSERGKQIRLQIFDNEHFSPASLLYDSKPKGEKELDNAPGLTLQIPLTFNNHPWYLRLSQMDRQLEYGRAYGAFFGGTVISLLLFGLIISLLSTRFMAQQLAERLTVDLRESEEKYRFIFNNKIYAICIFDLETFNLLDANEAQSRLYGYSREELISGMTIHDIWTKHQLSETTIEQSINAGTTFLSLQYHRKKDGAIFPVEIVGEQHVWKGQKVMFALAHDITERKQAEEALHKSEERFRKLFEHNTAVSLMIDPDTGNIVEANKAAADFYGWSLEELRQMRIQEINTLSPEAIQSLLEKTRSLGSLRLEVPHRKADGSIVDVEVFSSRIEAAGKSLFYSIFHDITERKQAEEALRNQQWRLESIIEGTRAGTWEWNVQTGATIFNDRWAEMIGYTLEELAPISIKTWERFAHPDDLERSAEVLKRHFAGEIPYYHCECRVKHRSGHWIWMLDRGRIITHTDSGKPLMMFGTHTDINERKQAEEENVKLERLNRQTQKNESLNRMAGAIAHHFNNQLGVLIGNIEMAIEDLPSDSRPFERLGMAMQGARKAVEVSSLMLTYLGQTTGKFTALDLAETCRQCLPLLQAAIPKSFFLKVDLPTPGPIVKANANQIQQILTNLVTNAWEAIDGGQGIIDLIVKTVSQVDIPPACHFPIDWQSQDKVYACLEVRDSGTGIAVEDIENLFDPFFSSKFTGRGLGLAVVLGIVKAHGGVVSVESKKETGSIFRIFLPVSEDAVIRQPDKTTETSVLEGGGTMLLVEDEDMMRNMAETMLTRLGFKVLLAKDGVEAVEVFKQHRNEIDVVLSDLTMPRMNGWETLAALRQIRPDIPVVLASGHDESKILTGDKPELSQIFLHKPYQKAGLKDALARAMKGSTVFHL